MCRGRRDPGLVLRIRVRRRRWRRWCDERPAWSRVRGWRGYDRLGASHRRGRGREAGREVVRKEGPGILVGDALGALSLTLSQFYMRLDWSKSQIVFSRWKCWVGGA